MDSAPATQNTSVAVVDAIIHEAIMDVAKPAAIKAAQAALPWLALPGLSSLFGLLVGKVFGYLGQFLEQAAAFSIIDAQTSKEAAEYQSAVNQLRSAAQTGDPHAISAATQTFQDTLARLIHFDGR